MVIPRFVSRGARGRPLEIHGDGTQTRCFCHVQDTIRALAGADGRDGDVGRDLQRRLDGTRITILELARARARATGSQLGARLRPVRRGLRAGDRGHAAPQPAIEKVDARRSAGSRRRPRRDPRRRDRSHASRAGGSRTLPSTSRGCAAPGRGSRRGSTSWPVRTIASRSMPSADARPSAACRTTAPRRSRGRPPPPRRRRPARSAACIANRSACSSASLSSLNALPSSIPPTKYSKRSTSVGSSSVVRANGESSIG